MEPTDITIQILTSIRDEVRGVKIELSDVKTELSDRIETLNERVDQLHNRQVETEIRLATELIANRGTMNQIVDLLREQLELRPVVEDHEERIKKLEAQPKS